MMRLFPLLLLLLTGGSLRAQAPATDLHRTVAALDSTFFAAYNRCDIATQDSFYSDRIEFFHDQAGLDTSKASLLAKTRKYICNKVRRELIPGSIEVSPIPGYGAVELGMHQFRNSAEPDAKPRPSRFMIVWKQEGDRWRITKVISLHG
ncbi:nuclear transport factor 2 family protein [Flaviaesturariibacter amylovorans]|uniref:Nuclear transport factor 2 family protein n=1 Tax=Flaviaesturariibacter amylovorans TaxID=1084520 RepID=A0ABP8HST0_9BACT